MQEHYEEMQSQMSPVNFKLPSEETANINLKAQPFKVAVACKVQSASQQQNCGFIHMHLFA